MLPIDSKCAYLLESVEKLIMIVCGEPTEIKSNRQISDIDRNVCWEDLGS